MRYRATRDDTGHYTIHDVPIFGEVPKGTKGAPFDIGKDWLKAALAKLKKRHTEGYFPPVHANHHGDRQGTWRLGHFRATKLGKVRVGGQAQWSIFVDVIDVPEHAFEAIMRGEYPFRSVEIISYEDTEIDTLAFLDDDAPFFKYPLLNGKTIELDATSAVSPRAPALAAFAKREDGKYASLWRFTPEESMSDKTADAATLLGDLKPGETLMVTRQGDTLLAGGKPIQFEGKPDMPEDKEELEKLLKAIKAKLARLNEGGDDDEEKPVEPDKEEKAKKAAKAEPGDEPATFAALRGEVSALRARLDEQDRAQKAADKAEQYARKLEEDGYHVTDATREELSLFASKGDDALKTFDASFRRNARKDGPETLDGLGAEDNDDPAVLKFQADGPDAFDAAKKFANQYDELRASAYPVVGTKQEFVERRMAAFQKEAV